MSKVYFTTVSSKCRTKIASMFVFVTSFFIEILYCVLSKVVVLWNANAMACCAHSRKRQWDNKHLVPQKTHLPKAS